MFEHIDVSHLTATYFNELAHDIHHNENRKWWYDENGNSKRPTKDTCLMLIITELSEAVDAVRKDAMDDKLPHRKGLEVELADAVLRTLDFMVGWGIHPFRGNYKRIHMVDMTKPVQDNILDIVGSVYNFQNAETVVYEILDLGYNLGIDVMAALHEKRIYNQERIDHLNGTKKF